MNFCFRPKGPNPKVFWTDLLVLGARGKVNSLQAKADPEHSLSRQRQSERHWGLTASLLGQQE